jgi:hypothetical protein
MWGFWTRESGKGKAVSLHFGDISFLQLMQGKLEEMFGIHITKIQEVQETFNYCLQRNQHVWCYIVYLVFFLLKWMKWEPKQNHRFLRKNVRLESKCGGIFLLSSGIEEKGSPDSDHK